MTLSNPIKRTYKQKRPLWLIVFFAFALLGLLICVTYYSYRPNSTAAKFFASIGVYPQIVTESLTTFKVSRTPLQKITKKSGSCVLLATQKVYCSGDNSVGQLGNGSFYSSTTPSRYRLWSPVKDIQFPCAITIYNQAFCTGYNGDGRLGNGTTVNRNEPVLFVLPDGEYVRKIVYPTCALTLSGKVYCSGDNSSGQLGNGNTANQSTPTQFILPAGEYAEDLYSNGANWCVKTLSNNAYCAGNNFAGQLTTGNTINQSTPVKINLPSGVYVKSISGVGANTICILSVNSDVYCSGWNGSGELGLGYTSTVNTTSVKLPLPAGEKVKKQLNKCILTYSQKVYCRGSQTYGEFGVGDTIDRYTAVQSMSLPSGESVQDIGYPNTYGTCVLTVSKKIYCAGHNVTGALGNGTFVSSLTPTQFIVPAGVDSVEISGGCALSSEFKLFCPGINTASPATPAEYIVPEEG